MRLGILSLVGLLSFVCLAQSLPAALVMSATGVYDEQAVRLNTIETTATPTVNGGGTVSYTTLNDFKTRITTAFANGTGGVINFDNFTSAQALTNECKSGTASGKRWRSQIPTAMSIRLI